MFYIVFDVKETVHLIKMVFAHYFILRSPLMNQISNEAILSTHISNGDLDETIEG